MDIDEDRELVDRLLKELVELETRVEADTRKISAVKKILQGYMELHPELEPERGALVESLLDGAVGNETPRGAEAVRLVMQQERPPGYPWLVSELVDELRQQNWLPTASQNPANAVRTALERLAADPEKTDVYKMRVYRDGSDKVAYKYDPDRAPDEPTAEYHYEEEPF